MNQEIGRKLKEGEEPWNLKKGEFFCVECELIYNRSLTKCFGCADNCDVVYCNGCLPKMKEYKDPFDNELFFCNDDCYYSFLWDLIDKASGIRYHEKGHWDRVVLKFVKNDKKLHKKLYKYKIRQL